jgi:hypothetical protein
MKAALSAVVLASILALGASPAHAKGHHHPKKRALSVAKRALSVELPASPGVLAEAQRAARASFWLAADPHVPLATVQGKAIRSVGKRGKECGATGRWANPHSKWHAIDAWGQRAGVFEVTSSEAFDVTGCREVAFTARSGKPGAGLFVSDDSGYAPGASVADIASVPEKKRFERFLGALEGSFVNQRPLGKLVPWSKRTMFFRFDAPRDKSVEGRVDGAGKPIERPRRWAVSGGPILVVGYLGEKGQWKAATVKTPLGLADSYQPVAVFDMNGDGIPEIVVRVTDGPTFADHVLSLDPATMTWSEAAESPGGGAL